LDIGDTTEFELELHKELRQNLPRKELPRRQRQLLVPDVESDGLAGGSETGTRKNVPRRQLLVPDVESDGLAGGSETGNEMSNNRFSLISDDIVDDFDDELR
jgi:hypothetical protein